MARSFNGTSDQISLGDPALLQLTGAMTVSCWVNLAITNTLQFFFAKTGGSSTRSFAMYFEGDTSQHFTYQIAPTSTTLFAVNDTSPIPTANTWVHVAGVFIPSTALQIWVNGTMSQNTASVPASQFTNNTNPIMLGARPSGIWLNGRLADARIYNVALTEGEISLLRYLGEPRPSAKLGHWPLWGRNSPEPDISGNGTNGTLTGTAIYDHPSQISATWLTPNPRRAQVIPPVGIPYSRLEGPTRRGMFRGMALGQR